MSYKHLKWYKKTKLLTNFILSFTFIYFQAHAHNAPNLCVFALDFITANLDTLTSTKEWMDIMHKNPELMTKIMKKLVFAMKKVNVEPQFWFCQTISATPTS